MSERPDYDLMHKTLTFILAMFCMACFGQVQKPAARVILPEDVVQDSIKLVKCTTTNTFLVEWTYTEAGAKQALASWEADGAHYGITPEWKQGWLKHKSQRELFRTRAAAQELVEKLKKK
jgi:hypothetical protein